MRNGKTTDSKETTKDSYKYEKMEKVKIKQKGERVLDDNVRPLKNKQLNRKPKLLLLLNVLNVNLCLKASQH